jgi:hypothetical protein
MGNLNSQIHCLHSRVFHCWKLFWDQDTNSVAENESMMPQLTVNLIPKADGFGPEGTITNYLAVNPSAHQRLVTFLQEPEKM